MKKFKKEIFLMLTLLACISFVFAWLTNRLDIDDPGWSGDWELFTNPCGSGATLQYVEVGLVNGAWSFIRNWGRFDGMVLWRYVTVVWPLFTDNSSRWVACNNSLNTGWCLDYKVRFFCDRMTRSGNCIGLPSNAYWNTVSTIIQYFIWGKWTPTLNGTYNTTPSTTECRFKCNSWYNYQWSGNLCSSGSITRTGNCFWLPANASWNTVSTITQYYVWGNRTPSLIGVYNTTPSTTECRFKCDIWYYYQWSGCFQTL